MPQSDLYGRLHVYLQAMIDNFIRKFHRHNVVFEILHASTQDLRKYLKKDTFTRIDVSAIAPRLHRNTEIGLIRVVKLVDLCRD